MTCPVCEQVSEGDGKEFRTLVELIRHLFRWHRKWELAASIAVHHKHHHSP